MEYDKIKENFEMTGKELVFAAIERKKVSRIPWVPFCGIHSASLIGKTATEYLKSSDLMVKGLNEAIKIYKPDGSPDSLRPPARSRDLRLRPELERRQPAGGLLASPGRRRPKKLEDLKLPDESDGRIPAVVEALKTLRAQHPDLAIYGLITGPFTLALHLLGTDIFMGMFDCPDRIKQILDFCAETGKRMSEIFIKHGCDIIAVVDPMTTRSAPSSSRNSAQSPR
jgi:uroporphyrinogen decarboxylase